MRKNLYVGYSSFQMETSGSFKVNDIEAVKLDLLNHIFTRRGERVRMPTFGTIIPDLAFEPLDGETMELLETELTKVFDYDPRVEMLDLVLEPDYDTHTLVAAAKLRYLELNLVDDMNINIQFGDGDL